MPDLENIKPGDLVFYSTSRTVGIDTVQRVTKTQVILSGDRRFRKSNGKMVGRDTWDSDKSIKPLTPRLEKVVGASRAKDRAQSAAHFVADHANRATPESLIDSLTAALQAAAAWREAETAVQEDSDA